MFTAAGQKLAPKLLKHFEKVGPPHLISLTAINRGLMGDKGSAHRTQARKPK
jgi:hypothetical protein